MKVIVVRKRSTWEQFNADKDAYGRIEAESLERMRASHERHTQNVQLVLNALRGLKVKPWVIEGAETAFVPTPGDIVLAVGGDGTFLSASHHVGHEVGIMGINSDPVLSRGRFCHVLYPTNAQKVLQKILRKGARRFLIPRMTVRIDGQVVSRRVLNEALYSHTCPAAMTRVAHGDIRYACSGLWIGTSAGSTGALRSAGGRVHPLRTPLLQAVIREPFEHKVRGKVTFGNIVVGKKQFEFISKTADATLYLDGPFLRVPVGMDQRMEFLPSSEALMVLGPPLKQG